MGKEGEGSEEGGRRKWECRGGEGEEGVEGGRREREGERRRVEGGVGRGEGEEGKGRFQRDNASSYKQIPYNTWPDSVILVLQGVSG